MDKRREKRWWQMKKIILAVALLMAGSAQAALIPFDLSVTEIENNGSNFAVGDAFQVSIDFQSLGIANKEDVTIYDPLLNHPLAVRLDNHPWFDFISHPNGGLISLSEGWSKVYMELNYRYLDGSWEDMKITASNSPVPEPSTMLLFGSGLVGLASIGRRKKKV